MPIFEYTCPGGHDFEVLQLRSAASLPPLEVVACPCCEEPAALRPSIPRFNLEFPAQQGGVHSMSGAGKRARFRDGG